VFALFVGIVGSCWVGGKGNYNQVSFANIDAKSTFSIILYDSKNFKEYKKINIKMESILGIKMYIFNLAC